MGGSGAARGGKVNPAGVDRYLVVGNPIAHSRSPEIHAEFARQTGQALSYERQLIAVEPAAAFGEALAAFAAAGVLGLNVTLPFKERAFACAGQLSERARLAGAVNTISLRDDGIHGDNTDGAGLVTDMRERLGADLAGSTVLLLGAGGAARGVVMALLQAGVAGLTVANRTPARAQALAAQFNGGAVASACRLPGIRALALAHAQGADLVINATSSGVLGGGLSLPTGLFRHCALAYDCVYGAGPTGFMQQAEEGGAARTSDGLGMLIEQAAESFRVWRGVRPHTAPVYRKLRAAISATAAGAGVSRN